jgi:hypothetical protein
LAAGSAIAVEVGEGAADIVVDADEVDSAVEEASDELSLEHETAPKIASALKPAAATDLR